LNLGRKLVHSFFTYPLFLWYTQILEYPHTAAVFRLIFHAGHDVKMHMGMVFIFCKLNHVSLDATGDLSEGY